jgi:Putative Ig domain
MVRTVRLLPQSCGLFLLLLPLSFLAQAKTSQGDPQSLEVIVQPQTAVAGENFNLPTLVRGGIAPYIWRVEGELPPGLKLHPHKGGISGVPTTPGEYRLKLIVTDSNVPQQQAEHEVAVIVIAGLTMDWKQIPKVQGNAISGSVVLSNQTEHSLEVTVIVVAVNNIGRATALGYQHFTLAADKSSPVIPFGSSPGLGTYTVRADAAAHRKSGHHIFRASKQTVDVLDITQN